MHHSFSTSCPHKNAVGDACQDQLCLVSLRNRYILGTSSLCTHTVPTKIIGRRTYRLTVVVLCTHCHTRHVRKRMNAITRQRKTGVHRARVSIKTILERFPILSVLALSHSAQIGLQCCIWNSSVLTTNIWVAGCSLACFVWADHRFPHTLPSWHILYRASLPSEQESPSCEISGTKIPSCCVCSLGIAVPRHTPL